MSRFVRPRILEMSGYIPGFQPEEPGWIKLNQNENPYPPSPTVAEAVAAELATLRSYPETSSRRVREAAAAVYSIPADQVLVTNGSDEMLRILLQACAGEGDEVIAFYPSYTYYKTLADIQGARFRLIDFTDDYGLPERLELKGAKLVFLPNPNAPSGTLFSDGDIARLCAACPDGLVVVDEAYADFASVSAIGHIAEMPNLFVCRTFSKSYSLAGLRLGLGFGSRELIRQLDKVRDFYDVDRLAQAGARAALLDQEYLRATCRRITATRARLAKALAELGVETLPSQANFLLARFGEPSAKVVFDALCERKVLVRYFQKPRLEDCLRISIGTDAETDALLVALRDVLEQ